MRFEKFTVSFECRLPTKSESGHVCMVGRAIHSPQTDRHPDSVNEGGKRAFTAGVRESAFLPPKWDGRGEGRKRKRNGQTDTERETDPDIREVCTLIMLNKITITHNFNTAFYKKISLIRESYYRMGVSLAMLYQFLSWFEPILFCDKNHNIANISPRRQHWF